MSNSEQLTLSKAKQMAINSLENKITEIGFFVMNKEGQLLYKNNACKLEIAELTSRDLLSSDSEINSKVINLRKEIVVEESAADGSKYLSVKSPLIDNGVFLGVVVFSIDIDKIIFEELRIASQNRKRLDVITEEVLHDIHSPIDVLSTFLDSCNVLPEKEHDFLKKAVGHIREITSRLAKEYKKSSDEENKLITESYILVSHNLSAIVETKNYQFIRQNIVFNFLNCLDENFVFIKTNYDGFKYVISTLIDCIASKINMDERKVDIGFYEKEGEVEIYIDNGADISSSVIDDIFDKTKSNDNMADEYIQRMKNANSIVTKMMGQMKIDPRGYGTRISLIFEKAEAPKWFVKEVVIPKGAMLVILDDEPFVYDMLYNRLESYEKDLTIKGFRYATDAIDFIERYDEKENLFLITDYCLKNQELNGIDVIDKCGLYRQAILITNYSVNKVFELSKKDDVVKFLSKSRIPYIKFKVI